MSTPWSAPIPILKKLVELFPTLTFACHFVEECDGIDETETYAAQCGDSLMRLRGDMAGQQ